MSDYTNELIIASAEEIDARHGTHFAAPVPANASRSPIRRSTPRTSSTPTRRAWTADVLARRGLMPDGYVLFLSRLAHAKGVDDLIDGFAAQPGVQGPDARDRRQRARGTATSASTRPRRPRADRIVFLDDVDDDEKSPLMAGCAAFVLPSKPRPEFVETFGIALVEKMLAGGGPVITTDTGGIGEAVGDTAMIVPVGVLQRSLTHSTWRSPCRASSKPRWPSGHVSTPASSTELACLIDCSSG